MGSLDQVSGSAVKRQIKVDCPVWFTLFINFGGDDMGSLIVLAHYRH